jgi:cellulose synthase/poly-beta-1,6-N-acetylglucosamine synthase-like glycosyltransferase
MHDYILNDQFSRKNVHSKEKIEVSIIIPSYNKYPLNLLTLYSLEKQNFDFSKMEVLLIDDASEDQTSELLENYQPPYHFNYIRCKQNNGMNMYNSKKGQELKTTFL